MRVVTTIISMLLVSLLLFPMMAFAAVQPIHLFMNGKQLSAEVAPQIVQGNTVVPVRIIAESLGAKVKWDEKSRKVTVDKDDVNIQLTINKKEVTVNKKRFQLEAAPSIMDGSTMLPLRFVSEQLGVEVTWDELTRSVFLFRPEQDTGIAAAPPAAPEESVTTDIKQEAGSGKETESGDGTKASDKPDDNNGSKEPEKTPDKPDDMKTETPPGSTSDETVAKPSGKPGGETADKPSGKPEDTKGGKPATANGAVNPDRQKPSADGKDLTAVTTIHSIALTGDQLTVKTSGAKATPNVTYSQEPNRIIIDLPSGQLDPALKLGTNGEGTIKVTSPSVSKIRYLLFSKESSIVRIIIDLSKKVDLKASNASSENQLVWALITPKDRYRVVIDPGHGGDDTGAVSITKRYEKDFVLAIGLKIHKLLEKEPKIEALITRKDDTFVELPDRAAFANDRQADLFVSVHGNSYDKETVRGVETYYFTEQSLPFAQLMHKELLKSTGFPDRKVKQSGFHVIKNTTMPSLLLELGFLSNETDENTMFQDAFQNRVAASIVAAIKQQLNID